MIDFCAASKSITKRLEPCRNHHEFLKGQIVSGVLSPFMMFVIGRGTKARPYPNGCPESQGIDIAFRATMIMFCTFLIEEAKIALPGDDHREKNIVYKMWDQSYGRSGPSSCGSETIGGHSETS